MKDKVWILTCFALILLLTPLLLSGKNKNTNTGSKVLENIHRKTSGNNYYVVYNNYTKKIENIPVYNFICGVVAGEMPADFHPEALKAQAVASYTFCSYLRSMRMIGKGSFPGGADVEIGSSTVAYIDDVTARSKFGNNYGEYMDKIRSAVNQVFDQALFYDGDLIDAMYCDMSSGMTESSRDVFNEDRPYLQETASPGDSLAPGFETHVSIGIQRFRAIVSGADKSAVFDPDPAKWITIVKRSGAGGVMMGSLCGRKISGSDIRFLFGLRSNDFSVTYANNVINFDVKGYGHGVGMSQQGAEYMAQHGKTWQDIVKWYYKGITVGNYLFQSAVKK